MMKVIMVMTRIILGLNTRLVFHFDLCNYKCHSLISLTLDRKIVRRIETLRDLCFKYVYLIQWNMRNN